MTFELIATIWSTGRRCGLCSTLTDAPVEAFFGAEGFDIPSSFQNEIIAMHFIWATLKTTRKLLTSESYFSHVTSILQVLYCFKLISKDNSNCSFWPLNALLGNRPFHIFISGDDVVDPRNSLSQWLPSLWNNVSTEICGSQHPGALLSLRKLMKTILQYVLDLKCLLGCLYLQDKNYICVKISYLFFSF